MKVSIESLRHHPLNQEIYTLSDLDELVESIKSVGLLQPLTIDQHNQVISGNRRFAAIKKLGWRTVEANRIKTKNGEESLILIHFNKQRVKTIKEILSEYDHLKEYYSKNKTSKDGVTNTREQIGNDIRITDGQLARILFIRKHDPELIPLIDNQILTVNQAYLQCQRSTKEKISISFNNGQIRNIIGDNGFKFYQKSSHDMCEIPDGAVNLIYTSPPYWNKRLYSEESGLGNERNPDDYVTNLVEHLKDCHRVLNKKGVFYLNLGDTYKDGNLQNIPHKIVIKLQQNNWILRNTIIVRKSNPKPSSSKSNLTPTYEFLFMMTKSMDYDYVSTLTSLSEKTKPSLPPRHRSPKNDNSKSVSPYLPNPTGRNMGDFWDLDVVKTAVVNQKVVCGKVEHPAMFNEQIVYLPLLQSTVYPFKNDLNVSPLILDLFCGSLTVYRVIQKINNEFGTRLRFIGYDIKKYF